MLSPYYILQSIMNMPTGIVPVTLVEETEQNEDYKDQYNDYTTQAMTNSIRDSAGLPVCVQVSTLAW